MNAATTHIVKRLMVLAAAAAVVALVVARSATSDDTPSASGQDAADAVLVVDAFPDLAGEGTGWPDCPGCDGEFRPGDALLASDDPLPTLGVQLTTADGVTRTATTRDMTEGRQQAVFELPEPVDVTITLTSIPDGWSRCGGVPARTRLTEADFDDDGRAAVAFAMGLACSAQQTPSGFADTLREALDRGELDAGVFEDGVLPSDEDEPTLAAAARALGLVSDTIASEGRGTGTGTGDDGSIPDPGGDADRGDVDPEREDDAGASDERVTEATEPTHAPSADDDPEGSSRDDVLVADDGYDAAGGDADEDAAGGDAVVDDATAEKDADADDADAAPAAGGETTGVEPGGDDGVTRPEGRNEEPTGDRLPGDREPQASEAEDRTEGAGEPEPIDDMGRDGRAEVAAETREPDEDGQPATQTPDGYVGPSGDGPSADRRTSGELDGTGDAQSALQSVATSVPTSAPMGPTTTKGGIPVGGNAEAGELSGKVYLDRDLDGERSATDEPMIGVRVRLSSVEDVRVVRTDEDGAFRFEDLYAAAYDVAVEPPVGLAAVGAGEYGRLPVAGRVLEGVDFALTDRPVHEIEVEGDGGARAAVPDLGPDTGGWMGPVCCSDDAGATWMAPFGPPMHPWGGVDAPRLPATGSVGALPSPGWAALAAVAGMIGFVGLTFDRLRRRGRR